MTCRKRAVKYPLHQNDDLAASLGTFLHADARAVEFYQAPPAWYGERTRDTAQVALSSHVAGAASYTMLRAPGQENAACQ